MLQFHMSDFTCYNFSHKIYMIKMIRERAKSLQSCLTLCNLTDCSPPGSSVHGILQARILEWVAMSSSRDLPDPETEPTSLMSAALAGRFYH